MRHVDSVQNTKAKLFQELNATDTGKSSDPDLLQQFSDLLDKISLQLNRENSSVESFAVESIKMKPKEVAECESKPKAAPSSPKSSECQEARPQAEHADSSEASVESEASTESDQVSESEVTDSEESEESEESDAVEEQDAAELAASTDTESDREPEDGEVTEVAADQVQAAELVGALTTQQVAVQSETAPKESVEGSKEKASQDTQGTLENEQRPHDELLSTEQAQAIKPEKIDARPESSERSPKSREKQIIDELVRQMEPKRAEGQRDQSDLPTLSAAAEQALRSQLGDAFVDKNFAQSQATTPLAQLVLPLVIRQLSEGSGAGQLGVGKVVSTLASQNNHVQPLQLGSSGHQARKEVGGEGVREKAATTELSQQRQLRTLEKVEQALKEVAKSRDGKSISLRLDPPSLGRVKVDVTLRDGVLHARLAADNPQVNQLLREKAFDLQRVLRTVGLEVDQVSVSVRDESGSQTFDFQQSKNSDTSQPDLESELGLFGKGSGEGAAVKHNSQTVVEDHWVA